MAITWKNSLQQISHYFLLNEISHISNLFILYRTNIGNIPENDPTLMLKTFISRALRYIPLWFTCMHLPFFFCPCYYVALPQFILFSPFLLFNFVYYLDSWWEDLHHFKILSFSITSRVKCKCKIHPINQSITNS